MPGTVGAPTRPNTVNAATYHSGCILPCMVMIPFSGVAGNSNSSPYVDYASDVLYVGDDSGNLHKFTGVFNGTPAEEICRRISGHGKRRQRPFIARLRLRDRAGLRRERRRVRPNLQRQHTPLGRCVDRYRHGPAWVSAPHRSGRAFAMRRSSIRPQSASTLSSGPTRSERTRWARAAPPPPPAQSSTSSRPTSG